MGILDQVARRMLREELADLHGQQADLTDRYRALSDDHEFLQETMTELSLYLEDRGWMRLSGMTEALMLKRSTIGSVAEESRVLYLKNPLIQRGVNVKRLYVWGQGMTVQANDPDINDVIQDFMNDRRNRIELTAHQARMLKEVDLQCDGNLFFVLFVNPSSGYVRLGSIPFSQMQDIVCNPEDAKEPWYYLREWAESKKVTPGPGYGFPMPKKAYYRDWHYTPTERSVRYNDTEVRDGLIYHIKVGSFSDWKWGMSEHLAAQDWAIAYKEFLEDWASIVRSYRRFAWKATGGKSKAEISAIRGKMGTTLSTGVDETQPPPVTGAMAILREGRDLTPIRTAGATVAAEDGRRLLLMVAAVEGLPETFFGDVSVGTLATATAMDRPTELMMRDRQQLWMDIHEDIFDFVLLQAVKAANGPLRKIGLYRQERMNNKIEEWVEWRDGVDTTVDIDFPPLLESSAKDGVDAVVAGATLRGLPLAGTIPKRDVSRMILQALGADDIDATLDALYPEESEGSTEDYTPGEEALRAAAAEFRDALDWLIEKHADPD